MKLFFKLLGASALILTLVLWFGFLGPWCVSAPAWELVASWIITTIIIVLIGISILAQKLAAFFKPRNNQGESK